MKLARLFRKPTPRRPNGPELYRSLIARHAPGRTFLDVGCMWAVNGAYAFHALASGATRVGGLDVEPASAEFLAENASRAGAVEFVQGDVNDPGIPARLGAFDVVFCAGVLYHVPDPIHTLNQLRRLCRRVLILAVPGFDEQPIGQAAFFLPWMDASSRERLSYPTGNAKRGLDTEFRPEKGYGNWFWAFTPSCVRAMARFAGFGELEFHHWGRLVCLVAAPAADSRGRGA